MNLPNKLTVSRIFLTLLFVLLLLPQNLISTLLASFVFCLASLTDYYDGYLAKKYHLTSDFGKIMDPIADKFLILAAFFIFVHMEILHLWMFLLVLVREVGITGLRIYGIQKGKVIAAEKAGKFKTVSQIVVISVVLVYLILNQIILASSWSETAANFLVWINILMFVAVFLTIFSGLACLWNNRALFFSRVLPH